MKRIPTLIICLNLIVSIAKAQEEKSQVVEYLTKRGYSFPESRPPRVIPDSLKQWPDTLYYNTAYKPRLLGSPTIPISFSRIERVNGQYQVTPTISIGYGYAWFWGSLFFNENDKITVDPTVFFGLIGDVALQSDFSLNKFTGFFTGGFIGFGNFSFYSGYDYITSSPLIGIGGRIDLYTFHQNSLKPFGKIRERRKHKKSAPPIINE